MQNEKVLVMLKGCICQPLLDTQAMTVSILASFFIFTTNIENKMTTPNLYLQFIAATAV